MSISILTAEQAQARLPELIELLRDAVDTGASVGYLLPLDRHEASAYWQDVIVGVAHAKRILLIATNQQQQAVGTVQLILESRPNGNHRAEVSKLLVHSQARRQGIGQALMLAAEQVARDQQRSLLVLDTRVGDHGATLYRKLGFAEAGVIPNYVRNEQGVFEGTVVMYKLLSSSHGKARTISLSC
jgi:ribosomal protein S18 acetylase RimI-like enzyme